ncbi:hypothetical protein thsrh120_51220 [Rhizobium sp. No.120]
MCFWTYADLLDMAALHNRDLVGHGHGFHLVVGYIDGRRIESLMQLPDFFTHLYTQLGVEVGQRLIEQEVLRRADDCRPMATRWRWPPES